ncbi:hypothetical protein [Halomonas sp. KRD171]|uniref:hypothetical protein n=1 Tax=Halomonas sp. KRD171 TaxID=2729726 RepID=UPI0019D2F462|nr:hypothetical protein [Halomonas sp. KRD171]
MNLFFIGSCLSSLTLSRLLQLQMVSFMKKSFNQLRADVASGLIDSKAEIGCASSEVDGIRVHLQNMLANDNQKNVV